MDIEDIKRIKDSVYELEGLLELAQMREDKIGELTPLIESRIRFLADNLGFVPGGNVNQPAAQTVEITELPDSPEVSVSRDFEIPGKKPAFCLNDRFRFRRELFSNSDAEFSSAMNMIAAMESYEEAEEYFIGQLGWDMENQEVADFMEIIRGYFEA